MINHQNIYGHLTSLFQLNYKTNTYKRNGNFYSLTGNTFPITKKIIETQTVYSGKNHYINMSRLINTDISWCHNSRQLPALQACISQNQGMKKPQRSGYEFDYI